MVRTKTDIVIVGMGPVGAAMALFLAHDQLRVVVVDKSDEVYELPRAVGLDGEIVRAFQGIGRGQQLAGVLQSIRPGERAGFVNSKKEWLFGQELRSFGRNGWPPMSMFDQPELEHFIRAELRKLPNVTICTSETVASFSQTDALVTVVTDKQVIEADWMIACDGAASPSRKALGFGWQDLGYDHDWLVVDVTLNAGIDLPAETLQVCDPERIVTYVGSKDPYRRWEFKLKPGEDAESMLNDEKIASLLDSWLPRDAWTLRRKAVYQFHAATANRWREGRVFIAGDAAHQTPPFLGQGLNAGMRDIVNLSWKLSMVHHDVCAPELLDTYESERSPHAQDLVEWAVALGGLMEHLAATEAAARLGEPEPVLPEQKKASGYGQGREAPPLRNGVIMVEQVSDEGSTGYLFSQPIIEEAQGKNILLDELLGTGFVLVCRDEGLVLSEVSHRVMERLKMKQVMVADLEVKKGRLDPLFDDAEAAIVRPDRYVFGHTSKTLNIDQLIEALAIKLCLN